MSSTLQILPKRNRKKNNKNMQQSEQVEQAEQVEQVAHDDDDVAQVAHEVKQHIEDQNDQKPQQQEEKKEVKKATVPTAPIIYANEFDISKHVQFGKLLSDGGVKIVNFFNKEAGGGKVLIQLDEGGFISGKFGVEKSGLYDHTNVSFTFSSESDDSDYAAVQSIQKQLQDAVIANRKEWRVDEDVEDAFLIGTMAKLTKKGKLKKANKRKNPDDDTERWNATLRTMFKDEDVDKNKVVFEDVDGNITKDPFELLGSKWESIVLEISGIFFQGSKIGISRKLRHVVYKKSGGGNNDAVIVPLPKRARKN